MNRISHQYVGRLLAYHHGDDRIGTEPIHVRTILLRMSKANQPNSRIAACILRALASSKDVSA